MVSLEKPVIGSINGIAAGAGCGVAPAADIRIAADNASFMLAFSRIGLIPTAAQTGSLRLLRIFVLTRWRCPWRGPTGAPAARALEWGMVNYVVPARISRNHCCLGTSPGRWPHAGLWPDQVVLTAVGI